MSGKVIQFRRKAPPPPTGPGDEYDFPRLVRDPETGLYGIVLQGVEVYSGLDPVGKREAIKQAAIAHMRAEGIDPDDLLKGTPR